MNKSKNQISMADKLSMRIQEMKQKPVEQLTGSEVIQSVVGAISAKPQQKPSSIILYLREGLNVAERNFTKYPNEIHDLIKSNLKEMSEGILYMYLWWISWGFGKNYCRVGYGKIVSKTLIGCIKTAQRAMESLVKKGFVIKGLTDKGKPDVNTKGALYRVLTPKEVLDGKTEEGVPLEDIPINGVVMKYSNKAYSNGDYGNNDHSGIDLKTMDSITMLGTKQDNIRISKDHSNKDHSNKDHPFKDRSKDSFKDSLSKDEIIDQYYNSIGQEKLSKAKRERAKKCFEELIQDGFTNDDIQFAVEWTIRNAKEKPYDFSLIKDTIGQAMAAKKEIEIEEQKRAERDQKRTKQMEKDKKADEEREKINAYKESLSPKQKSELREKALNEIKKSGTIRQELIGEPLIDAKENEILGKEMNVDK